MKKDVRVGFIGVGNMGEAMVRGLLAAGVAGKNILALDADQARRQKICGAYKVRAAKDLAEIILADAIVIAVKPQQIDRVLADLAGMKKKLPVIVTVAAGVPLQRFQKCLGPKVKAVRVMPNTPGLIGQGVSGYFVGPGLSKGEEGLAGAIISALGPAYRVMDETLMDAVTGLSGSGPAYVFVMIEAMADAGVMMGLPRALSLALAAHTVAGAARLVLETGEHPAVLKDKVASPGGTTIHGLAKLEGEEFRGAIIEAVAAATKRSRELGKNKDD